MKNELLVFLIFFLLSSCKVQKELTITKKNVYFKGNEYLIFTVKNISKQDLTIINPFYTKIEYKYNSEWRNVKILYCPCGAPCAKPPKKKIIKYNGTHQYKWNKYEEWCGGELNRLNIPKTFSKKAISGLYRIKIEFKLNKSIRKNKYYQFKIN